MEFWNRLSEALKQKGFTELQIKKLKEMFGHMDAAGLQRLSQDRLLPAMPGRTVNERRGKAEAFMAAIGEAQSQEVPQHSPGMPMLSYLQIIAGGEQAPILFGEDNTQSHVGETDVSECLECSAFEVALETGQQGSQGASQSTGHRVWQPAYFALRIGKSTPFLFEAARMNKRIDLVLHMFNVNQDSGVIEQHFQYRIQQGRIISVRLVQADVFDPVTARPPQRVEISVVPNVAEAESITGGTVMVDNWATRGV